MFVCCVTVWVAVVCHGVGIGVRGLHGVPFFLTPDGVREWTQVSGLVGIAFTCQAISVAEISPVYTCGPTTVHVCLYLVAVSFFLLLSSGEGIQTTAEIHFSFDFRFSSLKMSKIQVLSAQVLKFLENDLPYWSFCFRKYGRTVGRGHLTTAWKQILRSNWQNIGNWHWWQEFEAGYLNLCHR